ncbi:MAG TPA: DUF2961 domain-containing protein, partial [Labilithrix sp.]
VTSFDRAGGNDDGFGGTYSQVEKTDANGEHAIFDVVGPGVLRTLWFTSETGGYDPLAIGTVRFYFDGEDAPRIAMDANAIFHGDTAPFLAPLVADNHASTGGFVSWVPLPFRDRLRVTTQVRAGFYQAHYETFPLDWDVTSWTSDLHDPALEARFAPAPSTLPLETVALDVTRQGSGVVDVLRFSPSGSPPDDVIRAARIQIAFDDATSPQIDAPLASFFGSRLGDAHVSSIVWTMQPGLWESRMPMPFWRNFHVVVSGLAGTLALHVAPQRFAEHDAGWLWAIAREERPTTAGKDYVYADVTGAGKLVATVLGIEPTTSTDKQWWEGDLRSRVDGQRSPSIHGTGHEDDHLGGWSNEFFSGPFSLPMNGEPKSTLIDMTGQYNADVSLYRIWPGIPFLSGIRHTTEHGSGNARQEAYSSTTFVYMRPAARIAMTDTADPGGTPLTSTFEGEDAPAVTANVTSGEIVFTIRIEPDNAGVLLRRLSDQAPLGDVPEEARLEVDGTTVAHLFTTDTNASRRWLERDLFLPPSVTRGKGSLGVRIVPITHYTAARFEAWSVVP